MKVHQVKNDHSSSYKLPLEQAVEQSLTGYYSYDQLEKLRYNMEAVARGVGALTNFLVDKKLMTLEEAAGMFAPYGSTWEEIK